MELPADIDREEDVRILLWRDVTHPVTESLRSAFENLGLLWVLDVVGVGAKNGMSGDEVAEQKNKEK